jgi:hypothetical protein
MKDEKAKDTAHLRREHYRAAFEAVRRDQANQAEGPALDTLEEGILHLLGQLEAAETMPAKQPPTGVWQVELTTGVVHNFVADHVNAGNGMYETIASGTAGMTTFMREYAKRAVAVLAVRSEKVVSYRRLGDWDGREVGNLASARWATASPTSGQPKSPFGAQGVNP